MRDTPSLPMFYSTDLKQNTVTSTAANHSQGKNAVPPRSTGSPRNTASFSSKAGGALLFAMLLAIAGSSNPANAQGDAHQGPPPVPPTVTATVDLTQPGSPVPQHFLGFSMDSNVLPSYVGDSGTPNRALVNLINNFDEYNGAPSLRPATPTPQTPDATLNSKYLSALDELEDATHSPLIVTIGLGRFYPQYAANAAASIVSTIGEWNGLDFELGNEPDQLVHQGHRPSTYNFSDYLKEYQAYQAAVSPYVGAKHAVGMASGTTRWDSANQTAFLQAEASTLAVYTSHEYPLSACSAQNRKSATIAHLLSPNISTAYYRRFQPLVAAATPYGVPVRAGEMNSVVCSGLAGVSNTFASSLWVLDSLFELDRAGSVGMNLHTGSPASGGGPVDLPYNAFYIDGPVVQVRPIYYGMLMFAQGIQDNAAPVLVTTVTNGSHNVKIWATLDQHRRARIVVIEKDLDSGSQTVAINLGRDFHREAKLTRLVTHSSQGVAATNQVFLAGQTFDGTKDGRPVGHVQHFNVRPHDGVYTITVPDGSAAMLTVQY